jgi:hypothetical protein
MAKCWQCSVRTGSVYQHCGRCDCCRPMNRPRPSGGGGGGGDEKPGCILWTFAPAVATLIVILFVVLT